MNKKIIAVLTALAVLLLTVACTPAQKPVTQTPTAAPTADAAQDATLAPDTTDDPDAVTDGQDAAGTEDAVTVTGVGIAVKPKTVTTEMTEITLLIANNSGKTYSTDYVQTLEVLKDGKWETVPLTSEAVALGLIIVPDGELTEFTFDFANHYAALEKGTYRITKTFLDDAGGSITAACEFDLF